MKPLMLSLTILVLSSCVPLAAIPPLLITVGGTMQNVGEALDGNPRN